MQAETYYNHFNMQKLYGGGGYGGTEKGNRAQDIYATVTWNNAPDGRCIALGWMSNWQYA